MDTIVIHPKNKEQLAAIKAFARALKMEFEITQPTSPYDPKFANIYKSGKIADIKKIETIFAGH